MKKHFIFIWIASLCLAFCLGLLFGEQVPTTSTNLGEKTLATDTSVASDHHLPLNLNNEESVIRTEVSEFAFDSAEDKDIWQWLHSDQTQDALFLNEMISLIVDADVTTLKKVVDNWDTQDNNLISQIIILTATIRFAELDPAFAIRHLLGSKEGENDRNFLAVSALESWTAREPDVAIDWYLSLAERGDVEDNSRLLVSSIFASLAQKNVDIALDALQHFSSEDERAIAIYQITRSLASPDDFEKMLNVIYTENNKSIDRTFFSNWANSDLTAALDWYALAGEGETKSNARDAIFNSYIYSDPEQAANWYMMGASAESYENSLAKIVQRWAGQDTEAALQWVKTQNGIDIDNGVFLTLQRGAFHSPDFVAQQLSTITDQEQKEKVALLVYRGYSSESENGPLKAQKFLESLVYREALEKRLSDDKKQVDAFCY